MFSKLLVQTSLSKVQTLFINPEQVADEHTRDIAPTVGQLNQHIEQHFVVKLAFNPLYNLLNNFSNFQFGGADTVSSPPTVRITVKLPHLPIKSHCLPIKQGCRGRYHAELPVKPCAGEPVEQ